MKSVRHALWFGIAAILFESGTPSAAIAQDKTIDVQAGPIWNQSDAQAKCPNLARQNGGTWTGNWRTTVPGRMSVCEVRLTSPNERSVVKEIDAGPIWSQSDAQRKCPSVASANRGTWTGNWRTTVPGKMSVCEVRVPVSANASPKPNPLHTAL